MRKKISIILFLFIIFIAVVLRFYKLGAVPVSPDWDEVALGYNAYSIMQSSRDEYGQFLPVVLRSFDDYKPALYAYLVIPFIKFFGLNIEAVRLPSVLFGVLAILVSYFLVKKLFEGGLTLMGKHVQGDYIALLSAGLFAISPWHIQFSRVAFESNLGLAFNLIALLLFLKGVEKPKLIILSFIFAALNIYVYQSEKVFTPLLMIALVIIFRKEFFRLNKKIIFIAILSAFVVSIPMVYQTITDKNALLRAKGVSVFSDQTNFLKRTVEKLSFDQKQHDFFGLILDNRRVEYGKEIVAGYLSHFDLNWLFITGDITRHHAPFMGLLYLFELPFLFIGIYQLIFRDYNKQSFSSNRKAKLVVFSIFFLAPIPASVTSGVPHAIRTLNFLPMFQVFTAIGIITSVVFISKINPPVGGQILKIQIKYLIFSMYVLFFMFNFLYYVNQYFVQLNYFYSADWQYGYKETIDYIKPMMGRYQKILVSNRPPLDQSYMFFLFYLAYDSKKYQESGGTVSGGFLERHKGFLNFEFRQLYWKDEEKNEKTLFIGSPTDFPDNAKVLKTIYYLNGEKAISIVSGEI